MSSPKLVHFWEWMVEIVYDGIYCSELLVALYIDFLDVGSTSSMVIWGLSVMLSEVHLFSVVAPLVTLQGYTHTKGTELLCMPKEQCMGH